MGFPRAAALHQTPGTHLARATTHGRARLAGSVYSPSWDPKATRPELHLAKGRAI